MVFAGKTILVAPLDWGLGHASRCVPLIRQFSEKNNVIIGATRLTSALLSSYFPNLQQVEFSSYGFSYSKRGPQWLRGLRKLPLLFQTIAREKEETERYVKKYGIDVIVSDNRYGVFYHSTENIFVCHQVNLQLPFFPAIVNGIHRRWMRKFSEIWIPDYAEPGMRLAGKLSDDSFLDIKHRYIGPLSAVYDTAFSSGKNFDYLLLLSGPEPQRSILEEKLLLLMKDKRKRVALVRGGGVTPVETPGVEYQRDLCTGKELGMLIKASNVVICRSGYSTLMDLHLLGKKNIILIPTPGQPEQEYLAEYWKQKFSARVVPQRMVESIEL